MQPVLQLGALFGVVGFVIGLVALLVALGVTYWVYTDARSRNDDRAVLWGAGTLIGFLVGLVPGLAVVVVYLFLRE
jgi:uncharacterized membrane protein